MALNGVHLWLDTQFNDEAKMKIFNSFANHGILIAYNAKSTFTCSNLQGKKVFLK